MNRFILFLFPLLLSAENYTLSSMEKKSITMAKKWINNNTTIEKQKDGSLAFYYGDNMPTLICKPLAATTIKLEKGEELKAIKSGDSKRWKFDKVENAVDGRTFVLVKPVKANIMTNLILFTDKRIYNIKLISTDSTWIPSISFIYEKTTEQSTNTPTKIENRNIKEVRQKTIEKRQRNTNVAQPKKQSKYSIKRNSTWIPSSIYNKHGKTYIKASKGYKLFVVSSNNKTITYRHSGDYFIVNGIVKKAILVKDGLFKKVIHIRKNK